MIQSDFVSGTSKIFNFQYVTENGKSIEMEELSLPEIQHILLQYAETLKSWTISLFFVGFGFQEIYSSEIM